MRALFNHAGKEYFVDFDQPIDLSLSIGIGGDNANCYFIDEAKMAPFQAGGFIGSVAQGGSVNCEVITFCAHGNGTHTECFGHISKKRESVNQHFKQYHLFARLVTVIPEIQGEDAVITSEKLQAALQGLSFDEIGALVVRTLPNNEEKRRRNYSGSNPPYFTAEALGWIASKGIQHLLTDLPSIDRESDGGALAAHHLWWQYPKDIQEQRTITELIYVPNEVIDGVYLLNLQLAAFETDASPSRPLLFSMKPKT